MLQRSDIFPEDDLPSSEMLLSAGKAIARDWSVTPSAFLKDTGCNSEAEYKSITSSGGRIMQHAQIGYRDPAKSQRAWREVFEACDRRGTKVDRYGICLDWAMGIPRDERNGKAIGTGLLLNTPEDFTTLTQQAPVAPHFGDFVLGFPAAVENVQAALAAGSTSIGNLGQYFTFRLPYHDDDIAATSATLTALALIAAQPVDVLVHSNLDDGFAALFTDLSSALGAVLIEQHIVDRLIGARVSHCWGHHYSNPVKRLAFHLALSDVSSTPGTMIYGNTVAYRGTPSENYASLSSYLLTDIAGQRIAPSGHAINPVPVHENVRIPDIDEVIDAQLFAGRLCELAEPLAPMIDHAASRATADRIVEGGKTFFDNVIRGFCEADIDTEDPFEMLLAIRRIGGRRLEELFGAGGPVANAPRRRSAVVASDVAEEVSELAAQRIGLVSNKDRAAIAHLNLAVVVATSDVHEHGKLALEETLSQLGVRTIDGGVSVEAEELARLAHAQSADAIMVSTYNGVALNYFRAVKAELETLDSNIAVLIGGRLNQIPDGSNTSLPVDVTSELADEGAVVCAEIEDAVPALIALKETDR